MILCASYFIYFLLVAKNVDVVANQSYLTTPGTLIIYINTSTNKGHIATSLGYYNRVDGPYNPGVSPASIIYLTRNAVASSLYSSYGVSGLMGNMNFNANQPKLWMSSDYLGTDMNLGNNYSGPYNGIFYVDAHSPNTGVCVSNDPTGAGLHTAKYVLVPVNPGGSSSGTYIYDGLDYSLVFEPSYYLSHYSDLQAAFGNDYSAAFNHFITNGMSEARQAIATFNVINYMNRYSDLQAAFGNDYPSYYRHYIMYGYAEGRNGQ